MRPAEREGIPFLSALVGASALAFGTGRALDAIGFLEGRLNDWTWLALPFWSLFWPDRASPVSVPLWTPYIFCGYPYLSDPQTGLFYPVLWLLMPLPLEAVTRPFAFLHLLAAAWGAYRYARLDLGRGASGLAALIFGAGGVLLPHLYAGHAALVPSVAALPWALLGARRIAADARGGAPLLAAAGALALLGGHLPTAGVVLMGAVALAGAAGAGRRVRSAGRALAAAAWAAAAAGVSLLPAVCEIVRTNPRADVAGEGFAASLSWSRAYWTTFILPWAGGDPVRRAFPNGPFHEWWEMTCFVGWIATALAARALLVRHATPEVRRAAVVAAAGILLAAGSHASLHPLLVRLLPPLEQVRVPARFLLLAAWGIALLAAHGLEGLRPRRLAAVLWVVAAVEMGAFALPLMADSGPIALPRPRPLPDAHARASLGLWQPNLALLLRWRSPEGYAQFVGPAYRSRLRAETTLPSPDLIFLDPSDSPAMRALGVRYVAPFGETPPAGYAPAPAPRLWEVEDPRPRAFLIGAEGAQPVPWIEDGSDRLVLETEGGGGSLVILDAWHPDWRARVDGVPAEVRRAEGAFRSVEVPPGRHRVVFEFRPWPLAAGAASTVLAGLGLIYACAGAAREASGGPRSR